ncbi:sigma-70 family RNA polymerase sigma factor [Polyangium sp. y55x31]|uniref:sigma-70 family RNA polymerase sigma factor n=1 Tax=Polyangium sp. y55x31 TaxID=3042688 RepID=UPI002482D035|nr:sigma-70 family RNA polymerase sigma factor [Polyangium sp. y55x31]MDI1481004.1 sigma-70 family RNA polymerase sigma factor [Polyangium sp. y55x31]
MSAEPDALSMYRAEIARRRILSAEVERELAIRWKAGDREAGRLLIEACLSYVTTIAREYRSWGAPFEDLVQQGNIGLLQAAERFDPARGYRLATFANYWIRAEIRDYVTRNYRIVRLGTSKAERRAVRFYRRAFVRDATTLAAKTGLSEQRAHELIPLLAGPDAPIDTSPHNDGPADSALSPEAEVCRADERAELTRAVKAALAELSPREQQVLERRLMSDEPATLAELGAAFGVSKERIRQVEEQAKKRMRGRLRVLAGEVVAPHG